ncbi:MAG: hypothetical protein MHPSP_000601 [Paramarteilia canceri]
MDNLISQIVNEIETNKFYFYSQKFENNVESEEYLRKILKNKPLCFLEKFYNLMQTDEKKYFEKLSQKHKELLEIFNKNNELPEISSSNKRYGNLVDSKTQNNLHFDTKSLAFDNPQLYHDETGSSVRSLYQSEKATETKLSDALMNLLELEFTENETKKNTKIDSDEEDDQEANFKQEIIYHYIHNNAQIPGIDTKNIDAAKKIYEQDLEDKYFEIYE